MKTVTKNPNQENGLEVRQNQNYLVPEVNIFETTEGYIVEAEMPGVSKDGLEVVLEENELTLIGHRKEERPPGEPLVRESRPDSFKRVFELDPVIDTARITARMEQGLLTLTLPKQEKVKPRKIAIE